MIATMEAVPAQPHGKGDLVCHMRLVGYGNVTGVGLYELSCSGNGLPVKQD